MATVTVVVPTFNRQSMLKVAIDSILSQTYQDFEILVSDNCSSDGTQSYVESIDDARVIYLRHPNNLGMQQNWIKAIQSPKSKYIAILEDDNQFLPNHLEDAIRVLHETGKSFYACEIVPIDENGKILAKDNLRAQQVMTTWTPDEMDSIGPLLGVSFFSSTVVFESSLVERVEWERGANLWCMDYYFWGSMIVHSGFVKNPNRNVKYLWHANNATHYFLGTLSRRLAASVQYCAVVNYLLSTFLNESHDSRKKTLIECAKRQDQDLSNFVKTVFWRSQGKLVRGLGRSVLSMAGRSRIWIAYLEVKEFILSSLRELISGKVMESELRNPYRHG